MSVDAAVASGQVVRVGSRVTLREHGRVSEVEVSDRGLPSHRRVDPDSTLGVALLGRRAGDAVAVVIGHGCPDREVVVVAVAEATA